MSRVDRHDEVPAAGQPDSQGSARAFEAKLEQPPVAAEQQRETALGILLRISASWIR